MSRHKRPALALPAIVAILGCQPDAGGDASPSSDGGVVFGPGPAGLDAGGARPAFCSRTRDDAVRDVFCRDEPPAIGSLDDLRAHLDLTFPGETSSTGDSGAAPTNAYGGPDATRAVFLGHSTALSGKLVSPINPRAILLREGTFLAFNRGIQQVELAARDRGDSSFNFYLVSFEQRCNATPGGCLPGDLYTPRVESGWQRVRIEDDEDLKNTPSDCRQCHRRGKERSILLMRELDGPWTHFFLPEQAAAGLPEPSGADLQQDYFDAKGDEPYAGVPPSVIRTSGGPTLQGALDAFQPLLFDGMTILNERWPWGVDGYPSRPARSPTWDAAYEAFKRGEQLALPHADPRPTDPEKQARLTAAYRSFLAGDLGADELPEMSDVFPDDPAVRAEIGLVTEPSASPAEALIQACGTCHNGVLDQSLSRARFNIDLSRMDRAELDLAVTRLTLPRDAHGAMPPPGERQLDDDARARLIEYLKGAARPASDDALLVRAARLGMAGGEPGGR